MLPHFCLCQSDVHYVGQTTLPSIYVGPANGEGSLQLLVPGTPDCRAAPVGDGLIGVDGANCPFQMYTIFGILVITKAGLYTFCTTSADGSVIMEDFSNFHSFPNLCAVYTAQICTSMES
jgi:hypothetical protein